MGIRIDKPNTADWNYSHSLLGRRDKIGYDSIQHAAKIFLSQDPIPDFTEIEVEVINRCNNDCPFCPVNRNSDTRKPARMEEEIFYTLINQLKAIDYSGTIKFHSNNEPLLDNRIFDFIEYSRARIPKARHLMFTNGSLLDVDKFLRLTKSLDQLIIDNYDDDMKLIPPIQKIMEADFSRDFKCNVTISMRMKNQKLRTRGGKAPNRINEQNKFAPQSPCILPFCQMIIRPDGTAAKCCNDPIDGIILGDLHKQSILEIWRGKPYQELRKEMFYNGRHNIRGCTYCDLFGLHSYSELQSTKIHEHDRIAKELKLRKNLGAIYLFDIIPRSFEILNRMRIYGVEFDGIINVRNVGRGAENLPLVSLEKVLQEDGFILFPTPDYEDEMFNFFHANGYTYGRDYLIYTTEV
ncbi:MAG: SPASM domain-containing protein [Selenomonadaceae bacterium]|nr:SPASM domain-containing protein [Selenomonadaceae bacterium]